MSDEDKCPCDAVRDLQKKDNTRVTDYTSMQVSLAIITTRLNMLTGILGVIGIAMVGICAKLLFQGV